MKNVIIILVSLCFFSLHANAHGENGHKLEKDSLQHVDFDSLNENFAQKNLVEGDEHIHNQQEEHHSESVVKERASFNSFPTLHPLVVHFPIVLLLFAALFQIISFFVFKEQLSWVTLGTATLGLLGAYIAGRFVHPHTSGLSETAAWVLKKHELFADYTLWSALIAVVLKAVSHFFLERKLLVEVFVAIALIGSAYSVSEAGHYGAQLIHIEGVGAKGEFLELEAHSH
ncbi:MAG: hypothetical protein DWQ02_06365 [Bacteroidetes bacterium]|nr:MAG: hypothetical protein DWQ02_06365 [Bacteroidota bacterium]